MAEVMWRDEIDKSIVLSEVDESAPYEVDQAAIILNKETGKFGFIQASGCSCWDGDGEVEYFDDLDKLDEYISKGIDEEKDSSTYYISINGCKQLIAEAKDKFRQLALKAFD